MLRDDDPFWLVWSPNGPHEPSYKHETFGAAERESERLARKYRGQRFYIVEAKQYTEAPPDIVTKKLEGDVPF